MTRASYLLLACLAWLPLSYTLHQGAIEDSQAFPVGNVGNSIDWNDRDYYLGYQGKDYATPWAKYFNNTNPTFSFNFTQGLLSSPVSPPLALTFANAPKALNAPGYLPIENGYTMLSDGTLTLATQVDVSSEFTGEMFDFWFSWHTNDTTKYKLWYPHAHQYAARNAISREKASQKSYKARYWNVTSFVDEYIGDTPYKLSIGFFDPSILGFSTSTKDTGVETLVAALVNLFVYSDNHPGVQAKNGLTPLSAVLVHQVRRRPNGKGKEIRSRFWFGQGLVAGMKIIGDPLDIARELSVHCFTEMSHLPTFLPALFKEYRSDIVPI